MRGRRARRPLLLAALLGLLAGAAAWNAPATAQSTQSPHDATSHEPFKGVEKWTRIFDDPKRDEWQKPQEVVLALGLKPGQVVADLGAGTGYFEKRLSKAVSPGGMVLAIDTEPEMVRHLGERALQEGTANVVPVLALPQEAFVPPGRADCVLVVDTYHHIDDRVRYFHRMKEVLAPGGRIVIIDFHKRPLPVGPPPEHKLPREFVVDEMKQAGFGLADEKTFLPYHYFLIFRPETP
jgi:ubiquinone/menaquinone biosynthesis C-methylase UbiE